jgi:hypothetical protein
LILKSIKFKLDHLPPESFNLTFQSCIHNENILIDNIRIGELPEINLVDEYVTCADNLVELDAGGQDGYSYKWREVSSPAVLGESRFFTPEATGTYCVEVISHHGLAAFDTVKVTVHPSYNIEVTVLVCHGSSYTFPDETLAENITVDFSHESKRNVYF